MIADDQQAEEDPFGNVKTTAARYFGFYPTPDDAAERLFESFPVLRPADQPQLRFLEPNAGTGNLARRCVRTLADMDSWSGSRERWQNEYRYDNLVDCVEVQRALAACLQAEGIYNRVITVDFLQLSPETTGLYDRVVMNPPFDRERDIDHVMHALRFLKPHGCLHAIMSAGTESHEMKKATAFRALMNDMDAKWRDLPAGSFREVGTNVNIIIVKVWKDDRRSYY